MYYGHIGITNKCPDYQGVQIFQASLYDKEPFGIITECVDNAGVLIFKAVSNLPVPVFIISGLFYRLSRI